MRHEPPGDAADAGAANRPADRAAHEAEGNRTGPARPASGRAWAASGYLLIADRDNNRAIIVSPGEAHRVAGGRASRPRRHVLHTRVPLGDHERRVQRHADTGVASDQGAHLALRARRDRGLEPRLLEHARRRVQARERGHDDRGREELPHRAAHAREEGQAHPRRLVRARPAARLREPERGHTVARRRSSRFGNRRVDRQAEQGGRLVWSVRSPVAYPSDAQLLPNGRSSSPASRTPARSSS